MILEQELAKFSVFGLWTISNLSLIWFLLKSHLDNIKTQREVINNNTRTMEHLIVKIDNIK